MQQKTVQKKLGIKRKEKIHKKRQEGRREEEKEVNEERRGEGGG